MGPTRSWGKLALVGLVAAAGVWRWTDRHAPAERPAAGEARPAPAFSLPDVAGHPVRLESLRGHAVVVNFWASWCPPCRAEIPELSAFYRANHDRCFELLGVAESSGGPKEVAAAARTLGIAYPVLVDEAGDAASAYGISGLPHTVVLDPQGRVRAEFEGAIDREDLEHALAPLLPTRGASCPQA